MTCRTFVLSVNPLKYFHFIRFFKSVHLIDFLKKKLSLTLSFYQKKKNHLFGMLVSFYSDTH